MAGGVVERTRHHEGSSKRGPCATSGPAAAADGGDRTSTSITSTTLELIV